MSARRRAGGGSGGAGGNGARRGGGGAGGNGAGRDRDGAADNGMDADEGMGKEGAAGPDGGESPEEILEEDFEVELELAAEAEGISTGNGAAAKRPNALLRLYRGETSFDFIGNRRWWFGISSAIILISIISLTTRGLNPSIDFKGGQSWLVTTQTLTVPQATAAAKSAGVASPTVVQLTNQITGQKQIEVTADLNLA